MYKLIAAALCFVLPVVAVAAEPSNSYKVMYDGGSLLGAKAGNSAKLVIEENSSGFSSKKIRASRNS